ncbi:hypothetical protein [Kribbella sp. NPDC055071]
MTDTVTTHPTGADRPLSGQPVTTGSGRRRGLLTRMGGVIGYDVLLVPVGIQSIADAVMDEPTLAAKRWQRLSRPRHPEQSATSEASPARVLGDGVISSVLGLLSWFLVMLVVTAVVRGPFWGFVEHGPVEAGTWGGPSRAGAWVAHGIIAVPSIGVLLLVLWGISALHAALVRRTRARWVLPATIAVAAGGLMFFWSWLQQL